MPFALLPSLLSLIIIHLPPTTLSCDVLSLSVSLPLSPFLSLSLTYSTSFSSSHIQHTAFALSLSPLLPRFPSAYFIPIPRLSLPLPLPRSIVGTRTRSSPVGKKDKRSSRSKEKGRNSRGWVGSSKRKRKRKKKKRRKKEKEVRENRIGHSPFGIIRDVRPCDESHWKPGWQREQRCS